MRNNKQSEDVKQNQTIKTYTEEQVLKMLEVCRDTDLYEHILTFEDILKTETPTEVPSEFFEARNFGNDTEDVFKGD